MSFDNEMVLSSSSSSSSSPTDFTRESHELRKVLIFHERYQNKLGDLLRTINSYMFLDNIAIRNRRKPKINLNILLFRDL
jgi:hypothetical protein